MQVSATQRSAGARALALGITMAVVYLSTVPYEGWHDRGIPFYAFVGEGLPRYWTWFDVITNLLAYGLLGAAWLMAVHPILRGAKAVWLVAFGCSLLSFSMEAIQTFNPARYPQLLDWCLNSLGAMLGAAFCNEHATTLMEAGWLRSLRRRWFTNHGGMGIVLVLVWPLLSYFPSHQLFATGRLVDGSTTPQSGSLIYWLATQRLGSVAAADFCSTLFGSLAFAGLCLHVLKAAAPRLALIAVGLLMACAARSLAVSLSSKDLSPLAWLTPGAQVGLIAAFVVAIGLTKLTPDPRRWASLTCLAGTALISNLLPQNVYYALASLPWASAHWNNLRSSFDLLSTAWPFAAILFVVAHRTLPKDISTHVQHRN